MAKLKAICVNQTVVLLAVCVLSAMLGFALRNNKTVRAKTLQPVLSQQSDEKIIERRVFANEPYEVGNLSVKKVMLAPPEAYASGAMLMKGQKFSAMSITESGGGQEGDWLENLEFTIKNKSDKQITYIHIELDFPETGISGPMMVYDLRIGVPPKASENRLEHAKPLALYPEDTFTFTLSDQELKMIKQFIGFRNFQLAELNKVAIRISYVIFDDGMKWSQGNFYRPDPNELSGYKRIDQ